MSPRMDSTQGRRAGSRGRRLRLAVAACAGAASAAALAMIGGAGPVGANITTSVAGNITVRTTLTLPEASPSYPLGVVVDPTSATDVYVAEAQASNSGHVAHIINAGTTSVATTSDTYSTGLNFPAGVGAAGRGAGGLAPGAAATNFCYNSVSTTNSPCTTTTGNAVQTNAGLAAANCKNPSGVSGNNSSYMTLMFACAGSNYVYFDYAGGGPQISGAAGPATARYAGAVMSPNANCGSTNDCGLAVDYINENVQPVGVAQSGGVVSFRTVSPSLGAGCDASNIALYSVNTTTNYVYVTCPGTNKVAAAQVDLSNSSTAWTTNSVLSDGPWKATLMGGSQSIAGVACPSTTVCVAVDKTNKLVDYTTTGPGGTWATTNNTTPLAGGITSCVSTTACVTGNSGSGSSYIQWTTNCCSATTSWTTTSTGNVATAISYPSCVPGSNSCEVGFKNAAYLFWSTNVGVASVTPTWTSSNFVGAWADSMGCLDTSHCMAGLNGTATGAWWGSVGQATTWGISGGTGGTPPTLTNVLAMSCPSATECVEAGTGSPYIARSTNAFAANAVWKTVGGTIPTAQPLGLSCPSPSKCWAMSGNSTTVYLTTNPDAATPTWSSQGVVTGAGTFSSLNCPSASICVAGDSTSHIDWTTGTGTPSVWQYVSLPSGTNTPTPYGIGVNSSDNSVVIADSANDRAFVYNQPTAFGASLGTASVIANVATGLSPNGVAVTGTDAFVANEGSNTVTDIDPPGIVSYALACKAAAAKRRDHKLTAACARMLNPAGPAKAKYVWVCKRVHGRRVCKRVQVVRVCKRVHGRRVCKLVKVVPKRTCRLSHGHRVCTVAHTSSMQRGVSPALVRFINASAAVDPLIAPIGEPPPIHGG